MKTSNVITAGAILLSIAFSPSVVSAQTVHQTQDNKAKNIAKRNRAEKNGHPKNAVKDEKKVQHDNKELKNGK
jgi:hypothetical protein